VRGHAAAFCGGIAQAIEGCVRNGRWKLVWQARLSDRDGVVRPLDQLDDDAVRAAPRPQRFRHAK